MLGPNDLMLRDYAQILVEERLREAESIRLSRLNERPHDRFFCRFGSSWRLVGGAWHPLTGATWCEWCQFAQWRLPNPMIEPLSSIKNIIA